MAGMRLNILDLPLLLAAAFLAFAPLPAQASGENYLNDRALRDRAFAAFAQAYGGEPAISWAEVDADRLIFWARSKSDPALTDRWTVERDAFLLADRDRVTGPEPIAGDSRVAPAPGNFFVLPATTTGQLDLVINRATDFAGLAERPNVAKVSFERAFIPTGGWRLGEPRIVVTLRTPRESAEVYADLAGKVTGANLDRTLRVLRLDMLAGDDWPMADVQAQLGAAVGPGAVLHSLRIAPHFVEVVADHPSDRTRLAQYSWTYAGVARGEDGINDSNAHPERMTFSSADFDLRQVPAIKRAALAAFGRDGASVTYMQAARNGNGQGAAPVLWYLDLVAPDGSKGSAVVDGAGTVLETRGPWRPRPASR